MTGTIQVCEPNEALPPPLVRFADDRWRWVVIKIELLGAAVILAHVGMFIVAGLYYLTTQTNPTIKNFWDNTLVTNGDLRHSIRDVGEGVLGGFLAQAIVWNHYAKSHRNTGRVIDLIHERVHVPAILAALLSAIAFGAVGFIAMYNGLHALHVHASEQAPSGSLWARIQIIWTSSWDKKAMGYAAAFVARRPMHVVFDRAQAWFANRRVRHGKGVRAYHPPTFKARINDITETARDPEFNVPTPTRGQSMLMLGSAIIGIALAAYGFYVLTYLA